MPARTALRLQRLTHRFSSVLSPSCRHSLTARTRLTAQPLSYPLPLSCPFSAAFDPASLSRVFRHAVNKKPEFFSNAGSPALLSDSQSDAEAESATTVVDPSSPFMQEDTLLQRVAIMGYGAAHFDVVMPSATGRGAAAASTTTTSFISEWLPSRQPAEQGGLTQRDLVRPSTIAMEGAIMAFPTAVFLWSPRSWDEVTVESLAVVELLQERPELILFGTGSTVRPLPPSVASYLSRLGIGYEVLQSNNAAATFTLLSEEQRLVVAALIPYGDEIEQEEEDEAEAEEESRPSTALRRRIEQRLRDRYTE